MEETSEVGWGHMIEILRTVVHWSQDELAAKSGVSASTIGRQETELANPTRQVKEKLERALGVEGQTKQLQIFFGGLRAKMLDPEQRVFTKRIEEFGEVASQITRQALLLGLADLRREEEEPEEATKMEPLRM